MMGGSRRKRKAKEEASVRSTEVGQGGKASNMDTR